MHIPDGYLSPQTYVPAYAVMAPFWAVALKKLNKTLRTRQVPLLALGAAFSFVIMMFNVPIPGGTTGHAVGAVLIAILLGPWAAMIAVSLALIVQALVFGDGGITAIGANCLNMAVIMPFSGWAVYKLISGSAPAESPRHRIAGAIGGYVGLNLAAVTTGIMFGIQPLIAKAADGKPLYAPFGLKVAVPIMALEHLLLFGIVEAIATGLVIAYIQRTDISLIPAKASSLTKPVGQRLLTITKIAYGIGALIVLSPLGLILPAKLGAGTAWGEWSSEELQKIVGFVPQKLAQLSSVWKAPLPDYAFIGQESAPLWLLCIYYIISAVVGIGILAVIILGLKKLISRKDDNVSASGMDDKPEKN